MEIDNKSFIDKAHSRPGIKCCQSIAKQKKFDKIFDQF